MTLTMLNVGRLAPGAKRQHGHGTPKAISDLTSPRTLLRRATGFAPVVAVCAALLSACVALLGCGLLGFLFYTSYKAPAASHYVRPLHFDYSGYVAVAHAPLVTERPTRTRGRPVAPTAAQPISRFLPSGTKVAVYVRLRIPSDHTDLFQIVGELLSNATHVTARSVRTHIITPQPPMYRFARYCLLLPFHIVGWGHGDWVTVDLPLFDSFEDGEDTPVSTFRARLSSRNASRGGLPPPPVYQAEVHVRLKLGILQTVLSWVRPGPLGFWVVAAVGLVAVGGGTFGALGLLLLAYILRRWVASRADEDFDAKAPAAGGGGGAIVLPPTARRKKQPFGDMDEAVLYSLSHAQVYRAERTAASGGGSFGTHGDAAEYEFDFDDDGDASYGQRTASAFSKAAAFPPPQAEAEVAHGEENPWAGSSSGGDSAGVPSPDAKAAAGNGRNEGAGVSRHTSGAAPAADAVTRAASSSPWSPALKIETAGSSALSAAGNGGNGGVTVNGDAADNQEETGDAEEADGGGGHSDEGGDEEETEQSRSTPAKAAVAIEAQRGDLEPQADNEITSGGAVRKRSGFSWKA
ncbi:hypothetical protein GPECTOR_11g55 [Gonium pectorale]|uniref:Seipin n=1 Tax=Gonium pectorale TaxID=33097 RepID=A0A150GQ19_GONPE|nr:hypothetical protein GPECTOR_11g55 [Gonium pectorale]|eukprot:KXZ51929.1 hypothetical protein GPECTOR_11g55 [Gonium pectorale]